MKIYSINFGLKKYYSQHFKQSLNLSTFSWMQTGWSLSFYPILKYNTLHFHVLVLIACDREDKSIVYFELVNQQKNTTNPLDKINHNHNESLTDLTLNWYNEPMEIILKHICAVDSVEIHRSSNW